MSDTKLNSKAYDYIEDEEEDSLFDYRALIAVVILNWQWFVLSLIICVAASMVYLRYQTPVYMATTKMLIKDEGRRSASIRNAENLGIMSNSSGFDNELEILASHSIAEDAVKQLKLYTTYKMEGRIVDRMLYRDQPITVELDHASLEKLQQPISLNISYEGGKYVVTGNYVVVHNNERGAEARSINAVLPVIPARIKTAVGYLTFMRNSESFAHMTEGKDLMVSIVPPKQAAGMYVGRLSVEPSGPTTSIARLSIVDEMPQRATDYLAQLAVSYNNAANEDKNVVAVRTEEFINSRLEKINSELGMTEGQLESFKRQNRMIDVSTTASNAFGQSNTYDQKLAEMETQLELLNSISDYMNSPSNKYQTLPSNVGLTDASASSLINKYNEIALERSRLLRSASENSPSVIPMTEQLNDLTASIRRAMDQARNNYRIQRNAMQSQYSKYSAQIQQSPTQERILTQIGRQQEVRSGLYLMLLQKREENSIALAATADKGKLINAPSFAGKVSPDDKKITLIGFGAGLLIPFLFFLIVRLLRYRIEGHDDVAKLTRLPILADIPVASENAKSKADIVVHENKNNMMEEVFRSLRTNVQFALSDDEKVVMFTSSVSGEGKTFIAANLAVSFALLGKKVCLVGLDIRKPRLAELFGISDRKHGITHVLTHHNPTWEDIQDNILPSDINANLDLLMSGTVPPNPTELISRESLDIIFSHLRQHYDYIVVDTAPVGIVSDTLSIGRIADASIFVCRADYTAKSAFGYLNGLVEDNKLRNTSVVINAVDFSKKKYGYYYGYGKYGKYGKYSSYGRYSRYGRYGRYGNYGSYGSYSQSHYGKNDDDSIKK